MLKMFNLYIQICCPYIMETYGMILNEYTEKILKKMIINVLNVVRTPILKSI